MTTGKKRANSIITTTVAGNDLTFHVHGVGDLTLNMDKVSAANQRRATIHGMRQRVNDSAAIPCDPNTGKPATPAEKYAAMERIVSHYNSGAEDWAINRAEGGGGRESGVTLRAVAAVQGVDEATMRGRLEELAERKGTTTRALLTTLAKQEAVARKIAEFRAENASPDVEDLLAELGGEGV